MAPSLILLLAFVLRWVAARNDLWFDEIWNLYLVRDVHSWWGIFTQIHMDTNHYLQSLYLYFLGPQRIWFLYRLGPLITGVFAVWIAGKIGARRGAVFQRIHLLLFSVSFLFVNYSTESRGYSYLILFTLLAIDAFERMRAGEIESSFVLSVICALGIISHLTFLEFFPFLTLGVFLHLRGKPRLVRSSFEFILGPIIVIAALWFLDLRYIQHSPDLETVSSSEALHRLMAQTLGFPDHLKWVAVGVFLLVLTYRFRTEWMDQTTRLYLLAIGSIWVGAEVVGITTASFHPRYFLPFAVLSLLLLARTLSELTLRHRQVGVLLLILFCGMNISRWVEFTKTGRGHYLQALQYMVDQSREAVVTISGDKDIQHPMLVQFYSDYLNPRKSLHYLPVRETNANPPEWVIVSDHQVHSSKMMIQTSIYFKERSFGFWDLYHRMK